MDLDNLKSELWQDMQSIACCVHRKDIVWVISSKDNFVLDGERELKAYLEKGHIKQSEFAAYTRAFRGGISHLTSHTFDEFLSIEGVEVVSSKQLHDLFYDQDIGDFDVMRQALEDHLSFGYNFTDELQLMRRIMASRLPTFYLNFVRSIYLHMDWERSHESLAHEGWYARCEDFGHNVPVKSRYWWSEHADFWPVKHFDD